jgi:hypothetical protein
MSCFICDMDHVFLTLHKLLENKANRKAISWKLLCITVAKPAR